MNILTNEIQTAYEIGWSAIDVLYLMGKKIKMGTDQIILS